MRKSYLVAFVLAVLFGPLGLFYTSTAAALGFIIFGVLLGLSTCSTAFVGATATIAGDLVVRQGVTEVVAASILAGLLLWGLSIITNLLLVSRYNKKQKIEETRHREIISAAKRD